MLLTIRLQIFAALLAFSASGQPGNRSDEIAHSTVDVQGMAFSKWLSRHKGAFPPGTRHIAGPAQLDLYTPAGVSVYHGDDPQTNAAFIRGLPQNIAGAKNSVFRPSLEEAIEMVPEFEARKRALLSDRQYTLFAITFEDWSVCKPQNDAIEELRKRARQIGVRILEVRLPQ